MNWARNNSRDAGIVAGTVLIPVLLLLYVFVSLWGARQDYQGEIERLEPRIERQRGLIDNRAQLRESAGSVDAEVYKLIYPTSSKGSNVGASLQKIARQIVSSAGMKVTNSRILPVREQGGVEKITIVLAVTGSYANLDQVMTAINEYRPLMLVESFEVKPARPSRKPKGPLPQNVTANIQLFSLRAASP